MNKELPSRFSLFWQTNGWLGLIFIAAGALRFVGSVVITAYFEHREVSTFKTTGTVYTLSQLAKA